MTRIYILLIATICLQACTVRMRQPTGAEREAIVAEVLARTERIVAGTEQANADSTFQYHSEAMHVNDGSLFTRGDLVSRYRVIYQDVARQQIDFGVPEVMVLSKDIAVVTSQGSFSTEMKGGASVAGDLAWTYVWVRQDGDWVLQHAHRSFPGPIGRRDASP